MKSFFTRWTSKKIVVTSIVALAAILSIAWQTNEHKMPYHHTDGEIVKLLNGNLPIFDNGVFVGSGRCAGCHGVDPVAFANITADGELVNPAENWRGTMMANSAKDPFWRAKVSHETAVNPGHAQDLVNKCTSCHAPVGRYTNVMNGNPDYDITQLPTDSMARDGVNCSVCHQQRMEGLGTEFSGSLHFHTDTIWGPFVSEEMDFPIFYQAMQSFVGYTPVGNHKVKKSEMCAACHTLSTHTADLSGNYTGDTFIEQATYHEWLNSSYKTSTDPNVHKECQGCHMPSLNEPIVIASGYSFLPGRQPYGQHWFVGGNTFMLELLKNNITPLDLTANATHFNTVISRTAYQLQHETANVQLIEDNIGSDTAKFTVKITNLAGHKFPSGYPARRAFIEFVVTNDAGTEVFRSGGVDNNYRVIGENTDFEPHYNIINDPNEVQIYEMVMGDVNNNVTTVLERAKTYLKDNRLVPLGFSTSAGGLYDTTQIVGINNDPDFNYLNGLEGSGTDEVHYHIPVQGWNGNFHVTARLLYQTAPPRYMDEMFSFDTPEINTFQSMYEIQGPSPFEIALTESNFSVVGIGERQNLFNIFPNPSWDGWINIQYDQVIPAHFDLYDNNGKWIQKGFLSSMNNRVQLPDQKGSYLLVIQDNRRKKVVKLVRN